MSTPPRQGWEGGPPPGPRSPAGGPAAFAITGPPQIAITAGAGTTQFTVTNLTGRPVRARLLVTPLQGADPSWFRLAGPPELPLPVAGTATVDIGVKVPPTAPGGSYLLRLDAVPEDDTEAVVTGPVAAFTVPPPTIRRRPAWLIPLIVGVVVLVVAAAAAVYFVTRPKAPTNLAAPQILGTEPGQLGATLTSDPGRWKGAASTTLQWQRCQPATCVDIAGATQATYRVADADLGQTLRLSVLAWSKSGGTGLSTRAQSAPFTVATPPAGPVFTPRFPARSSFGPDATYHADVVRVALEGGLVVVSIDASGRTDLRPPETSCVLVLDASNARVATLGVHAWDATLSEPGHYQGDLSFDPGSPLPVGNYFLLYSCSNDYTQARIGTVATP